MTFLPLKDIRNNFFYISNLAAIAFFILPSASIACTTKIRISHSMLDVDRRQMRIVEASPERMAVGTGLILPGSGDLDEDGNQAPLLNTSMYKILSEKLSCRDINIIRYRKRSFSLKEIEFHENTPDFAIREALELIGYAKERYNISCVWLIGHSEGGLTSLIIANHRDDICGLILIASPGKPTRQILIDQFSDSLLSTSLKNEAISILRNLKADSEIADIKPSVLLSTIFSQKNLNYMKYMLDIDPETILSELNIPIIYLYGELDIQVKSENADIFENSSNNIKVIRYKNLNHYLKKSTSIDLQDQIESYSNKDLDIQDSILDDIVSFISKNTHVQK